MINKNDSNNGGDEMNITTLSLNLLKPDMAFMLKWLSADELARLETLVLEMTPAQYRVLKYSWGLDDDKC